MCTIMLTRVCSVLKGGILHLDIQNSTVAVCCNITATGKYCAFDLLPVLDCSVVLMVNFICFISIVASGRVHRSTSKKNTGKYFNNYSHFVVLTCNVVAPQIM